jgi:hypothetical protein
MVPRSLLSKSQIPSLLEAMPHLLLGSNLRLRLWIPNRLLQPLWRPPHLLVEHRRPHPLDLRAVASFRRFLWPVRASGVSHLLLSLLLLPPQCSLVPRRQIPLSNTTMRLKLRLLLLRLPWRNLMLPAERPPHNKLPSQ